jgi:hypothetical protein
VTYQSVTKKLNAAHPSRGPMIEPLEGRNLASVSYVQVGRLIRPSITKQVASYFSSNLPAGNFLIVVVGGSLTYDDGAAPRQYRVNDYSESDHGYKVVEPGVPRFNAPGLSVAKSNSRAASADSVGVYLKFRHSTAGKVGIELFDTPFTDNLPGAAGAPEFMLKERVVTPAAAVTKAAFSETAIAQPAVNLDFNSEDTLAGKLTDKLDLLT